MSKKFIIVSISLFCLGVILASMYIESSMISNANREKFVVYLLPQDSTEKTVLFTGRDIKEFDWEKQEIVFARRFLRENMNIENKEDKNEKFYGGSLILLANYHDKFLFSLNGEEIYIGTFKQSAFSSHFPVIPFIEDIESGIRINRNEIEGREEPRFNKELYEFLKENKIIS
ncbi:MAG: hypothetical protein ACLKAK_08420 [Alkaliphilus sp.]